MSKVVIPTCPMCGQVEVDPSDVTVTVCSNQALSTYRFVCPKCAVVVRKPACAHTLEILDIPGVVVEYLDVPAEAFEKHTGPPLVVDDLLDLLLDLERL